MAGNILPLLFIGGAAVVLSSKKKKKKKKTTSAPKAPVSPLAPLPASPAAPAGFRPPTYAAVDALPKVAPSPSKKASSSKWAETHKKRQQGLVDVGIDIGDSGPNKDGVDGKWGTKSKEGTAEFQEKAGIPVDGKWGPITDSAMAQALIRLAQGLADVVTTVIGAQVNSMLGVKDALEGFAKGWWSDEDAEEAVIEDDLAFDPNEEAPVIVGSETVDWKLPPASATGSGRYWRVTDQYGERDVWVPDSATALNLDNLPPELGGTSGSGGNVSTTGTQLGPNDHIVLDGDCNNVLHFSEEFLWQTQPRLIVSYALDEMTSSEDAAEIHERLLAQYAPRCASLGRSGVGDGVRSWWDTNVNHIYHKLQSYKNNPNFLEEDAEKFGL